MVRIARKSDGRRIFTDAFKREQVGRLWRGDVSLAQLSRKLGIAPSLLHRWKRLMPRTGDIAGSSGGRGTPAISRRGAQYVLELQRLVGKQAVELEFLRAELEALKRRRRRTGTAGL